MKRQAYQHPELRDANDNIIQAGTYGKETPLVNGDNTGAFDYINNNLEALYEMITENRIYAATKDDLPVEGNTSTIYITEDNGYWYLWNGAKYIPMDDARTAAQDAIEAANNAKKSAATATLAQTTAEAAKDSAVSSATAAGSSATEAATFASTANEAATSASNSANTATTQAENASSSADAAAASQTAAKTSETNAAESAAAAALSATQASAGQINADWQADSGVAQILNKPVIDTTVTDGSKNLVTSGAVATAIAAAITNITDGNGVSY